MAARSKQKPVATSKKTTRKTTTAKKASAKKATTAKKTAQPKKLSQLAAAITVLGKSKEPLNCKAMVDAMAKQKLWASPNGKTPHATLYAAILREINTKGKDARFKKTDRGLFTLAAK